MATNPMYFFRLLILSSFLAFSSVASAGFFDNISKPIKALIIGAVGFYSGGVIAGVATGATSLAYDELIYDESCNSTEIEKGNNQQLAGFLAEKTIDGVVWIIISFLIITNLITPFIFRWFGIKRERKDQNFREMEVKK